MTPPAPGQGYPAPSAPPAAGQWTQTADPQLGYGAGSPPPPGYGMPGVPGDQGGGKRGGKKVLLAGALVGAVAVAAGGAWAVTSFMSGGADPADAVPADALGMVKVNLDPSGSQKIEAAKMLRKFPQADDAFDFNAEDWRKQAFEKIQQGGDACPDVDYDKDIATWLGDRFAIAALPPEGDSETPVPIAVIEVKNADQAMAGLKKLNQCASERELVGYAVQGDWAVVAETEEIAVQALEDAGKDALGGDSTYDKWVNESGGEGLLTAYLAPAAGEYLGEAVGQLGSDPAGLGLGPLAGIADPAGKAPSPFGDYTPEELQAMGFSKQEIAELGLGEVAGEPTPGTTDATDGMETTPNTDKMKTILEEFDGMAMTLRFADAGLELEVASSTAGQEGVLSDASGDAVGSLPDSTMAAFGLGFKEGWVDQYITQLKDSGISADEIDSTIAQIEEETGLVIPDDLETVLGESFALSVDKDIDIEALSNSDSLEGLPVGLKVKGDAEDIQSVVDKVAPQLGEGAAPFLEQSAAGDYVAYGPDAAYRDELVKGGNLGDSEAWKSVIKSKDAASVFFVNFSAGDALVEQAADNDPSIMEWWKPLNAFGASGWIDGEVSHGLVRITTD